MCPVFPLRAILSHQLDVSFVHERSRLQSVIAAFTVEIIRGASPKLFVHQRHQPGRGLWIALIPRVENLGNVGFLRNDHALFYLYGN